MKTTIAKSMIETEANREIQAVSLFSGCGGTDLALQEAGYSIVWANDVWNKACDTYRANLREPAIVCGDITTFKTFPKAQLLVGCYPCQGYTQGGKRDWDAPVNFLYQEFERALKAIAPDAFIVENVVGMTFGANKKLLDDQVLRYTSAGYRVKWSVLNAKNFGVAQNRRRVFLVGIRSNIAYMYEFPKPSHGPDYSMPYVTQQDVLTNLELWPKGDYNEEPLHWYYLSRRRRCNWDEPSPCIVGHWRHVPLHPLSPPLQRISTDEWKFEYQGASRRLSYRECAALQGFPPGFIWSHGSVRDKFQMVGNAVPPPLFSSVLAGLEGLWKIS